METTHSTMTGHPRQGEWLADVAISFLDYLTAHGVQGLRNVTIQPETARLLAVHMTFDRDCSEIFPSTFVPESRRDLIVDRLIRNVPPATAQPRWYGQVVTMRIGKPNTAQTPRTADWLCDRIRTEWKKMHLDPVWIDTAWYAFAQWMSDQGENPYTYVRDMQTEPLKRRLSFRQQMTYSTSTHRPRNIKL